MAKMPGKPTAERMREYRQGHAVGQFLEGLSKAPEKRERRNARRAVRHFGPFRDGHNVLREKNGRFAKETAPAHRRPKRIPWGQERHAQS